MVIEIKSFDKSPGVVSESCGALVSGVGDSVTLTLGLGFRGLGFKV